MSSAAATTSETSSDSASGKKSSSISGSTGPKKTPLWQAKAIEDWCRSVMMLQFLEPDSGVIEFNCGSGSDLGKWQRAKVRTWVGTDHSEAKLAEAHQRWTDKKQPFSAQFVLFNPHRDEPWPPLAEDHEGRSHAIACFRDLETYFVSEERMRAFLSVVRGHLRRGGLFFGIIPDSSVIWKAAVKATQKSNTAPSYKSELFHISFAMDEKFSPFETRYHLRLEDGTNASVPLVHFPTLVRLCLEFNLELLDMRNCVDFLEDNRKQFGSLLNSCGAFSKDVPQLLPAQRELLSTLTTFVFVRRV